MPMILPPEVIEKIKKEREKNQQIRSPLNPEIPLPKDRLNPMDQQKRKKQKGPLIIDLA